MSRSIDEEIIEYGRILYPMPEPFVSIGWRNEDKKQQQWIKQNIEIMKDYKFKVIIAFNVYHHLKNMRESAADIGSSWCIVSTNIEYENNIKLNRWCGDQIYSLKDRISDILSINISDEYFLDILKHMKTAGWINLKPIPESERGIKGGNYKVIYNIYHADKNGKCLKHFQQKCLNQGLPLPTRLPNHVGGSVYYCTYSVRSMIFHTLLRGYIFNKDRIGRTAEEIALECMPNNIKSSAYIYDMYAKNIPTKGDYRITKDIVPERISSLQRDDGYKIDKIDGNKYILRELDIGSKWYNRFNKYYNAVLRNEIVTSLDLINAIVNDTKLAWQNRSINDSEFRRLFEMRDISEL